MKHIALTKHKQAIIDDKDYNRVKWHGWCAWKIKSMRSYYAVARIKKQNVLMHNFLMGKKKPLVVTHLNGNGLDNRRANLGQVKRAQTQWGVPRSGRKTSKFHGVWWCPGSNSWQSGIRVYRRRVYVGSFRNEKDAALAYDKAARKNHGEFARVNFPD